MLEGSVFSDAVERPKGQSNEMVDTIEWKIIGMEPEPPKLDKVEVVFVDAKDGRPADAAEDPPDR